MAAAVPFPRFPCATGDAALGIVVVEAAEAVVGAATELPPEAPLACAAVGETAVVLLLPAMPIHPNHPPGCAAVAPFLLLPATAFAPSWPLLVLDTSLAVRPAAAKLFPVASFDTPCRAPPMSDVNSAAETRVAVRGVMCEELVLPAKEGTEETDSDFNWRAVPLRLPRVDVRADVPADATRVAADAAGAENVLMSLELADRWVYGEADT